MNKDNDNKFMEKQKAKIAIVSLTSCEGCQFALLDLGERFFDFVKGVELKDFRLIEDEEDEGGKIDIGIIEGVPVTDDNFKTLKNLRERSSLLVVLGNCAAMGGVPEIKNYQEGKNTIKHVYKYINGIKNPDIREVNNFVRVDFTFPGCPINGEEFMRYMPMLIEVALGGDRQKIPIISDNPVCVECRQRGNKCLLLEKKPCFGPMILGGCEAVCPTARMGCQGCRGLRSQADTVAMRRALRKIMTDEEFENATEIFGLRDDIEAKESRV